MAKYLRTMYLLRAAFSTPTGWVTWKEEWIDHPRTVPAHMVMWRLNDLTDPTLVTLYKFVSPGIQHNEADYIADLVTVKLLPDDVTVRCYRKVIHAKDS